MSYGPMKQAQNVAFKLQKDLVDKIRIIGIAIDQKEDDVIP